MIVVLSAVLLFGVNIARAEEPLYVSVGQTTGNLYGLYTTNNQMWGAATQRCKDLGWKNLVFIESADVTSEVYDLMYEALGTAYYWSPIIGMNDLDNEGKWVWNDGTPVSAYTNWGPSQPDNHRKEDCAALEWPFNTWNDIDCGSVLPFICFQEPSEYKRSLIDDRLFSIRKFDVEKSTQELARSGCEKDGLRLAVVDSDAVIAKIEKSINWNSKVGYWVEGTHNCLNADTCEGLTSYVCEDVFPLVLSNSREDYTIGDTIEVECNGSGVSTVNVKWQRQDGAPTDNIWNEPLQKIEPGKATLIIKGATLEDSAKYKCSAANDIFSPSRGYVTFINITVHPEA